MAAAAPRVGRRTIEALLATHAASLRERSLVLVHGHYVTGAPTRFTATVDDEPRRVQVRDESSVLGVTAAWQDHRHAAGPGDVLVVTTGVDDEQLGWDLRGRAVRRRTLTVENAEVVTQRFGATGLDVRMYGKEWLLEALLEAEPSDVGWPRVGGLLTLDTALRALTVQRLGLGETASGPGAQTHPPTLDMDTLLAWSRTPAGPLRFAELPSVERAELKNWLGDTAGPAAPVLLSLAEAGLGDDAMALGILAAALRDPAAAPDTALAIGGLFGQVMPRRAALSAFTDAVEGTLTRWIVQARSSLAARQRVFAVLHRSEKLAETAGLADTLTGSRFLPTGFAAQLGRTVAEARHSSAAGETALADLAGHGLVALYPDRVRVAEMAVRVARWLEQTEPAVPTVAEGIRSHVTDWGWADRALTLLWAGDPGGDLATAGELRGLYERGRARRERLDEQFARRLAAWSAHATAHRPEGMPVIENVLESAVRPLTGAGAPLVVVLDGMSCAVAIQLGEEMEREGWWEVVPRPADGQPAGRMSVVSMLPSITRTSRASLLTGEPVQGGQSVESAGFVAFWKRRRREAALFHKADVGGGTGHALAHELMGALASEAVVAVVLNTIDDALDKGQQGRGANWALDDITHLRDLLSAARGYGRPVVLVADHGHVLERGGRTGSAAVPAPVSGTGTVSARWRTGGGRAGDGEIEIRGPRVLEGGGAVVAPWREDIRYTGRKAGYHGGVSLAEVTVPVLAFVAAAEQTPKGWEGLPRERSTPAWWREPAPGDGPAPASGPEAGIGGPADSAAPRRNVPDAAGAGPARAVSPAVPRVAACLGGEVVASEVYEAQKEYVRKAPEAKVVAAVIDALAAAGGTMSPAALAAAISATGRVRRNIEGFVATVQRLLNVEGYPVLGFVDAGHAVKLDIPLLRDQFLPKPKPKPKE
ncbi:BREX-2 system phosphatase PglZ [Streptomyces montanisoli]|uniref:BREX-2 system phosphatase PglZ n=1 Tax=Streptomyces montanisoli TaxID=2798581 RepID=A0A940ME43_9ACTN|nr:BREX-2 system phosphatase PglZ [Streptomyces montanisoli]MBP0458330.1 BREX-2 system phosphatase PglZ [Streptomyces montanisoli]